MSNISYDLQGDVGVGRGQLGLTDFITLSQVTTQLWIDAATDRPYRYFINANGANNTVRLPPIGTGESQAQVGHTILIQNTGMANLIINNSSGGAITTLTTSLAVLLTAQTATGVWQIITFSSGGEVNTASNVGLTGVGFFLQKVAFDLQFKNAAPASSKITIINDVPNSTVDFDVNESAIGINNLSGILAVPRGGTGVGILTAGNVLVGNGILPVLTTKPAPVGDFVGTTDIQVLTNKTITDVTNLVTATSLRTTTGIVDIAAAAAPLLGQVLTATSAITAAWQTPNPGEVNTASNVGLLGVGFFLAKVGTDLQFKNAAPASSKITIVNDIPNSTVDFDVNESAIGINNLSGILTVPHGGTGVGTLAAGNVLVGNGILPVLTTKPAPIGDFVGTTDTQILTNKTITDVTNLVTATSLRTATGSVDVAAAAAPIAGQVLTATSAIAANWQTPGSISGSRRETYTLTTARFDATIAAFTPISNFTWLNSRYSSYTSGTVVYSVVIPGAKTLDIRLWDNTNSISLGSASVLATAISSFSVSNPVSNADLELQIRRSGGAGTNPYLLSSVLEFTF